MSVRIHNSCACKFNDWAATLAYSGNMYTEYGNNIQYALIYIINTNSVIDDYIEFYHSYDKQQFGFQHQVSSLLFELFLDKRMHKHDSTHVNKSCT